MTLEQLEEFLSVNVSEQRWDHTVPAIGAFLDTWYPRVSGVVVPRFIIMRSAVGAFRVYPDA